MLELFAGDFVTAREQFQRAAGERGARLQSYPIDSSGPNGETLSVDAAYFGGATPACVLLVSSGIHGIEGIAGSALQLALIHQLAPEEYGDGTGILLVHALNPYGFAHGRRANEHNVDLNRNCLARFPGPDNEAYGAFADLLHPRLLPVRGDFFTAKLLLRALRYGRMATQQAIAGGQYAFADGLFYGGDQRQPSIAIFERILNDTPVTRARRVIHIDVHTGLGSYGDYQLLPTLPLDATILGQLHEWFGDRAVVGGASSVSIGYRASGSLRELSARVLASARVYALTLEFGTFAPLRVLRVLRQENWLHHHGGDSRFADAVKTELRQCFCPRDTRWHNLVLSQGLTVLQQALRALSPPGRKREAQ